MSDTGPEKYQMEILDEDGKTYAVFYNDKGEIVGKVRIKKTIEQWLEEMRRN